MTWLRERARPLSIVAALLVVGLAAGVTSVVLGSHRMKHATVYFPSTIGIYKGSSVTVLGVQVGQVDSVTPEGTAVKVTVSYSAGTRLPADVGMAQVPPSIVSDRYLQFTPAYAGSGPLLADHATIQEDKTEVPVELDQIFGSLNDLDVALGPNGANKQGALSQLVDVGAANLQGNGAQFNATLKGFSQAVTALADSRDQLFGTITSLQRFTTTLASDDAGVRTINGQLADVTGQLSGERSDLGAALSNLATALTQVQQFVADNKSTLTHDVGALTSITSGLVGEQQALKEVLDEAPVALHNLGLSYDPTAKTCSDLDGTTCSLGALSTRTGNLGDPSALVCEVLSGALPGVSGLESACDTLSGGLPTVPTGTPSVPKIGVTPSVPATLPSVPVTVPTALPSLPDLGGVVGGVVGGLVGGSGGSSSSSGSGGGVLGGLGSILLGGA
jgi:phospholipid/cholesterol/gamma-HCH transport system substrate-binding protein